MLICSYIALFVEVSQNLKHYIVMLNIYVVQCNLYNVCLYWLVSTIIQGTIPFKHTLLPFKCNCQNQIVGMLLVFWLGLGGRENFQKAQSWEFSFCLGFSCLVDMLICCCFCYSQIFKDFHCWVPIFTCSHILTC